MTRRIALIHATPLAIDPIASTFAAMWPEARLTNLLEDSLSQDLAAARELTASMHRRFSDLATYARDCGADAVLFTCSAFGPCIETARRVVGIPVLKPNEAMIEEALALGSRLALVATFEPSLPSMVAELEEAAQSRAQTVDITVRAVPGAMDALRAGRPQDHDAQIADAVRDLDNVDAVILAQFSMARANAAAAKATAAPVLTSPNSAVLRLKSLLAT